MDLDDVTRAVDTLISEVQPAHLDAAPAIAIARSRIVRRVMVIGVVVVALTSFGIAAATTRSSHQHLIASRPPPWVTENPTYTPPAYTPPTTPRTAPAVPGGIIGCPIRPVTPAPSGNPPPGVVAAAWRSEKAAGAPWPGGVISAVYRVTSRRAGAYAHEFADNVTSCGSQVAANSWVVELRYPSGSQLSAVVLAHSADGWHVFGQYA